MFTSVHLLSPQLQAGMSLAEVGLKKIKLGGLAGDVGPTGTHEMVSVSYVEMGDVPAPVRPREKRGTQTERGEKNQRLSCLHLFLFHRRLCRHLLLLPSSSFSGDLCSSVLGSTGASTHWLAGRGYPRSAADLRVQSPRLTGSR